MEAYNAKNVYVIPVWKLHFFGHLICLNGNRFIRNVMDWFDLRTR